MSSLLDRLQAQFADGLAVSVTESEGSLTLGFRSSCGREIPIHIRSVGGDRLLLSDGGETWSDLVGDGLADAEPAEQDARRLSALASMFQVDWSARERSFVADCDEKEALTVARQITMATIALDGWRVWVPAPVHPLARPRAIVRQTARVAHKAGFQTETDFVLPSKLGIPNRCPLLLRASTKQAAVQFDDASADHVAQHAMMAVKDSGIHTVVVTSVRTARKLCDSIELNIAGIGVVPRLSRGTPTRIVDMAKHIAA
jgi:hypothetical protein